MTESDPAPPGIRLVPYHQSLLSAFARTLSHAEYGRDFTSATVLLSQSLSAPDLRRELLKHTDQPALLGPTITTLNQWVMAHASPQAVLSDQTAELTLVEALQSHLQLFGDDNPWRVAEALRQLFTELTQQHVPLPDNLSDWTGLLEQAYGTRAEPLQREANIIFQLWQAWQQQLTATGSLDQASAYLQALATTLSQDHGPLYLVGIQRFTRPERDWLQQMLASGKLTWFIQAPVTPGFAEDYLQPLLALGTPLTHQDDHAISTFIDGVFPMTDSDLQSRARDISAQCTASPLSEHYHCLSADNPEQEARAIDLQVRQWLLEGKHRIGIITEDRRLARRVRALLERAGIELQDSGGWALSTTTAAAILERWQECIEQDFAWLPLLDLLKSPLLFPDSDRDVHLQAVYRLEQDIILHENIGSNLQRYQEHLDFRQRRLDSDHSESYNRLRELLQQIADAAGDLQALVTAQAPAAQCLAALKDSLEQLGIWQGWTSDAAGQRLISLWDSLSSAAQQQPLQLDWPGFRAWLGGNIERTTFRPAQRGGPVQLLTLEQSQGQRLDGLIIGGCDAEHLPGKASVSPFFNDAVRHELGLATWQQEYQLQLYHFRRVLQAAPTVLFTWHREDQGNPVLPSPWLDALLTLHELSFGSRLNATALQQALLQSTDVQPPLMAPLPEVPSQPRPAMPAALQPTKESPSTHQQLINCPYQYFAAQGLRLQAPEALREALAKSDYGERVHRCLEAFHSDVKDLPGPFRSAVTSNNRTAAIQLLTKISETEFAQDLEDNFQHRGWLKRWLRRIPEYIDWQITHQQQWQVRATEQRLEQPFQTNLVIKGRLDRIDQHNQTLSILDYKTGSTASTDEVLAGEAVQLPFYALLAEQPVTEVSYLKLDVEPVSAGAMLEGEELAELTAATRQRLQDVHTAIANQSPLPAWGDAATCHYCDMRGLCRKDVWDE